MLRALFLAPPGAGKGTQGTRLAAAFEVPYISTGEMLRQHVADETELGIAARQYMESGGLVPDDLVVKMVNDRIRGPKPLVGFVLDGFPRTINQAEAAYEWGREHGRTFHAVLSLTVPDEELIRRVIQRGRDSGRADDDLDTFRHRLEVYAAETEPLIEYYRDRGILQVVDGTGSVEDVAQRLADSLAPLDLSS